MAKLSWKHLLKTFWGEGGEAFLEPLTGMLKIWFSNTNKGLNCIYPTSYSYVLFIQKAKEKGRKTLGIKSIEEKE